MPKKTTKKSKPAKKTAPKKTAKKPKAKPAKKAAPPPAPKQEKEVETMDRPALKVIVSQLQEMGSDIKVFKSDTDEALQKKVNEALKALPPPSVMQKLESIVPEKLITVLKKDCIGIFIDLSDISCVRCKDVGTCARQFLSNVKGEFGDIAKALPEAKTEEKPKAEKTKIKAVTRYEEGRLVFVRDVKNPNPEGDPYHDTLQAVLDEQPETLGELRAIVERDFDIESDGDFMKFVTSMRDPAEGVIKLDVDLSEKNKAELRKAGVEI